MKTRIIQQPLLPAGYKQLEYIQSSGTQYIDTGKSFSSSTDTLKIVYENVGGTTSFKWAFGCFGGSSIGITTGSGTTTSNLYYSNARTIDSSYFTGQHTFFADSNGVSMDGTNVVSYVNFTTSSNLYLFATNNSGAVSNNGNYKIYSYKQTRNGSDIINFIPAQRMSDSVVGMYDTVTNTFFGNASSGTFTPGPEVQKQHKLRLIAKPKSVLPADYTQLEYVESTMVGKIVLDGTESGWKQVATSLYGLYYANTNLVVGAGPCTHFTYNPIQSGIAAGLSNGEFAIQKQTSQFGVMFKDTTKTLEQFINFVKQQYAEGTPLTIYYPLETAIATANKFYYVKGGIPSSSTYVPAKNNSNVAGLYCTETATFMSTVGSSTFTAGPEGLLTVYSVIETN